MGISDFRPQREKDKFIETIAGETAIRISSELTMGIVKFDADDSAPDYIGINTDKDATDAVTTWKVLKFTYSGSAVTQIEIAYGSWTGRAALF